MSCMPSKQHRRRLEKKLGRHIEDFHRSIERESGSILEHLAKKGKISTTEFRRACFTLTQTHGGLSQDMATNSPFERMYEEIFCSPLHAVTLTFMSLRCGYRQKGGNDILVKFPIYLFSF